MRLSPIAMTLALLSGCVVNGTPFAGSKPVANGATSAGPADGAAAAADPGACFAGVWKGGGDDANMRHLGFELTLAQHGAALEGDFAFRFEGGIEGSELVTGTADCAKGTAELHGTAATGPAPVAVYALTRQPDKPLTEGVEKSFAASWTCGDTCVAGTLSGYRQEP
ncbi:MAG: hypothetical protein K8W52_32950 [Deltaproteobacteria bacterium]|nr:hypothetical protein [Deltaproteobacteria bacterium]